MGSTFSAIAFDFRELERSLSRSLEGCRRLISRKGAELGHVLLLDTNRKSHYGESNSTITFDLW